MTFEEIIQLYELNKNIIKMNDDDKFDVDLSQSMVQVDDTDLFHPDETPSINLLNRILGGKIEIKNHDTATHYGNLFIEYKILKDGVFKWSGLSTTKADFWLFTIKDMAYFYPTEFLKYMFKNKKTLGLKIKNNDYETNYIGYGLIVPIARVIELHNNWTQHKQTISLQNVRKTLFNM